ncbi:hypothetical protein ZWY2020_010108 [Hordeum vulgare]|nr:hypothetical protein ZWY2020_010108 [Hordeum vulgare]
MSRCRTPPPPAGPSVPVAVPDRAGVNPRTRPNPNPGCVRTQGRAPSAANRRAQHKTQHTISSARRVARTFDADAVHGQRPAAKHAAGSPCRAFLLSTYGRCVRAAATGERASWARSSAHRMMGLTVRWTGMRRGHASAD